MQAPMSSSPAPLIVPTPAPPAPVEPRHVGRRRKQIRRLLVALFLGAAIAGAVYWQSRQAAKQRASGAAAAQMRTASVQSGILERTLRLAGTTAAEHYVSLIAPQLRGSRSGYGRDYSSRRSGGSSSSATSTETASSSSSSSSSAGSSSASGPSVSAMSMSGDDSGGSSGGGSSGISRATNRSSSQRVSTPVSRSSSSSRAASSADAAAVAADLGSTASMLPGGGSGGGGGGGGSSDFALILEKLTPGGTMVKKGDVVAEFDRQFMLLRLDDYRASVRQQELDMIKLQTNLEVSRVRRKQNIDSAKAAVEKAKLDLKTTPVRSEIDSERLRLALEEAEARYKQLLEEIQFADESELAAIRKEELDNKRAELELKRAEANADKMVARAAIDGLVVLQNIVRGTDYAQIQPGDQLSPGQFYMQIVDPRSMVVNATVNQVDAEALRLGQKARVRFDAYPDLELPAHVYSIGAMTKTGGMRASFFKEIPVKLRLDALDPRVIPDLSVAVDVIIEKEKDETAIAPLEAVFRDSPEANPYVFVKTAEGWERREVTTGLKNNIRVAIRSGLKPGEVVALSRPPEPGERQG